MAKRVDESISKMVEEKAQKLLEGRYSDLLNDIADMQERISVNKEKFEYYPEEFKNE